MDHDKAVCRSDAARGSCNQRSLSGMTVAVRTSQTPGSRSSTSTCRPAYCFPKDICPLRPTTLTCEACPVAAMPSPPYNIRAARNMYNCEHTPVKDLRPQEKQSRHLVRMERSDAPEDLRKGHNSFGETERHERFNSARKGTRFPPKNMPPAGRGRVPCTPVISLSFLNPLPPRLKRSVAGRARAVGCLTEPGHRLLPGRVTHNALLPARNSRPGSITRPAREFRQTLPGTRRNASIAKRMPPSSHCLFIMRQRKVAQYPSNNVLTTVDMLFLETYCMKHD